MSANISQVGGGGVVGGRRPAHQQISQVLYSQIVNQVIPTAGWQTQVPVTVRVSHTMNIITNTFLAIPQADNNQVVINGLQFERDAFTSSPDKATYEGRIQARVNDFFKKRQANEQSLHASLNAQAHAQQQSQAQMAMNQNMQMRGMGQPLQQGFQNFQQQMQPSPINPQGQPNMAMNPNGLPMNPNQQAMQMGGHMRPQMAMLLPGMANLSPQDRVKLHQMAVTKASTITEPMRSQIRNQLMQKLPQHVLAQLQQEGVDPLVFYYQQTALQNATKNQAAVNQASLPMQAHQQRSMAQSSQQLPTRPNGEYAPYESIVNQQKAGLLAQEAGQMVVPANTVAGPNVPQQPIGSLAGPNQGPGPSGPPHQLQQQFSHQPNQLKMDQRVADQRAAQTQAQIRAQAQAKQMQGQPGGLNGPGGVSQSPAMNTLNAPVRRPNQNDGHPQMSQGGMPFMQQMMDPRFNQAGQRTPMGAPGSNVNRTRFLQNVMQQMPQEVQHQIMSLPQDKIPEMIMRWHVSRGGGQMAGRPPSQIGQPGHGNPMAQPVGQFATGNANTIAQHPNLGMPINQQNQLMMQHHINKLRNPNMPVDRNAFMDNMPIPPKVMDQVQQAQGAALPEMKKWGQLKQWMSQRNIGQQTIQGLLSIQAAQLQSYLKSNQGLSATVPQPPQPNLPKQGAHPEGHIVPQMVQPSPNATGATQNIMINPREIQNAKNHEKFKNMPDEQIRATLLQMKIQAFKNQSKGHLSGPPSQVPQNAQPTHIATASAPTQAAGGTLQPPKQQGQGPETNGASSVTLGRNTKQPPNSHAMPSATAAPTAKTGTKRPLPDDAGETNNPSNAPIQRPQPAQAGVSSAISQPPQPTPEQLATLTPEQRQKYEAMIKNRLSGQANPMSDDMLRLKAIGQEQHQQAVKEQMQDIPMTPEQYRDTAQKVQAMSGEMNKIRRFLAVWYTTTRDDARARLFFKLRVRLIKQYVDGEKMTTLKDKFSITPTDLDSIKDIVDSMTKDLGGHVQQPMKKNPSQQNAETPSIQGGSTRASAPATQPAPLNAANLEKQMQALSRMHQRNSSRSGQAPAAPTTAQPPFSFGAQSPDGHPYYVGKPAVTQDNLQLPARKKQKQEIKAGTGPSQNGSSANASPQVQQLPSPEMNKRQAATGKGQIPPKPQFLCSDQYCDAHTIGFLTEEGLQKHIDEQHTKPAQDPLKYATEGLADLLRLDVNGKMKQELPADISMQSSVNLTKDVHRAEAANLREAAMKREGSSTGLNPSELLKAVAGKSGLPKANLGSKTADGATTVNGEMAQQATIGEPIGTTIDPQDLFSAIGGLETGGDGTILDMNVYRALTPNDTPDSKDSTLSEPNSDVSDGVAINVTLDMGFGSWDPFPSGHKTQPIDHGNYGDFADVPYSRFSWDDVETDFDKSFTMDTSLYSLDTF